MMKTIARWTSGLVSRVDWAVSQVENQEALVNSGIRDLQRSAARAKVQLVRVRRDGTKLREKCREEEEAAKVWRDRARKTGGDDETRALECLRRAKRSARNAKELRERVDEHDRTEKQLSRDIAALDVRLGELRQKRNLMRTRQSRSEALGTVRNLNAPDDEEMDDVFERWEMKILESELEFGTDPVPDSLEDEFVTQEEEDDLKHELAELLAEPVSEEDAAAEEGGTGK